MRWNGNGNRNGIGKGRGAEFSGKAEVSSARKASGGGERREVGDGTNRVRAE